VVSKLGTILKGRVGAALDKIEHDKAVLEAARRAETKHPPGYKDASKGEDQAAGDYLVWEQVLREAARRRCPVLLVTGDVKEDWWRREQGEPRGPRPELVEEMRQRAGVILLMLRPDGLLAQASRALQVDVRHESVQDVERVDRFLSAADTLRDGGWGRESIANLLARLEDEGPVQAAVIRRAAEQGGHVTRDDVYQCGEYEPGRQLKGFTRPVNRIVQEFRDQGIISETAVDVLITEYDPTANFGWASGFTVPKELVSMILLDVRSA
jgi:hypothetical protein